MSYAGIDASTLRVFALGTVGVETVKGQGFSVQVAAPQSGHGTGFAIDGELIVTAEHVVHDARHVVIRLPGEGGFLPARVVYSDEDEDIAVLHVDTSKVSIRIPPIRMTSGATPLQVRQTVFAVGYPLDPSRTQAQSAKGIIAGHLEDNSLQLGMSLNPGNSGGPLVDESDQVVGMVIARGAVEKGVQGIGIAVPISKIRIAIDRARAELGASKVPAISVHDTMSAEVVDELIRQGTLTSVRNANDLKKSFVGHDIEKEIEEVANRLNDPDLLVFVAGNLWNAGLALRYGGVREIGDTTLSNKQAFDLADNLQDASIRLTTRAGEIDATISTRSSFVRVALSENGGVEGRNIVGGYGVAISRPSSMRSRWTLQSYPHLRMNSEADGGLGFGLEAKMVTMKKDRSSGLFFGYGVSMGRVTLSSDNSNSLVHSYYATELGMGVSTSLGTKTSLEIYGGIAPSYYSATAEGLSGMETSESAFVFDHYRATVSLAMGRLYLSTGARIISSTLWLEPVGLGLNF